MQLRPLTQSQLDKLSDSELAEYVQGLEAAHYDKGRKSFKAFARMVEVPGAPIAEGVKFSDFRRELARERGEVLEDDAPDQEVFYPKLLNPAAHHDIIMETLQALIEETLLASDGEYADGAMFFAPPGSAKPVAAHMTVLMGDGRTLPISEVVVGDCVIGKSGHPCRVLQVHDQGILPCVRIVTDAGREIIAEGSHPFLTAAGWRQAEDLESGIDGLALMTAPDLPGCDDLGPFMSGAKAKKLASYRLRHQRIDQLYLFDRVRLVEGAGDFPCRCLTVEGDESFVVEDAVAHNSSFVSMLAPAYFMGKYPNFNVIGASYAQQVANRFSRRARHIVGSKEYGHIFDAKLVGDNSAVENWMMTNGSEYRAAGVQAAVTSFRADALFIDDPVAGREEADSEVIQLKTNQSYHDDLCSRLKPGGKLALVMTRWSELDLGGHILGADWKGESGFWKGTDGRLWYVVCLPLLAEHSDDPLGRKLGDLLWPQWFRMRDALRLKENAATKGAFHARTWSSLYQQRPAPTEGAIIKRAYWKKWPEGKKLPECKFIALFYDTSFEDDEMNDPSAMTAWGIFEGISKKGTGEEYNHFHAILLGAWEEHVESVDLPDIIAGNRHDNPPPEKRIIGHAEHFKPDAIVVEKRASGHYVIQELRRRRLPIVAWLPRGKSGTKGKTPRAWAAALIMEPGSIWYVDGPATRKVVDQCAQYAGEGTAKDDLLDTVTMAMIWFRDKYMFQHADEEMDGEEHRQWRIAQEEKKKEQGKRRYYGGQMPPKRVDDDAFQRMTPSTQRRLYGGG